MYLSFEAHGASAYSDRHPFVAVVRQERTGAFWLRVESCAVWRLSAVALLGIELGPSASQVSVPQDPPCICETAAACHTLDSFSHAAYTGRARAPRNLLSPEAESHLITVCAVDLAGRGRDLCRGH